MIQKADHRVGLFVLSKYEKPLSTESGLATKKNPKQSTHLGRYRLLPQLGFSQPGGRVSGDGEPPGLGLQVFR